MAINIEHNRSSGNSSTSSGSSKDSTRSSSSKAQRFSLSSSFSLSANSILKIVMLLLLLFSFCSLMFGHGYHFSLQTLLETVTSLPRLDVSSLTDRITIPLITADWGLFSKFPPIS